MSNGAAGNNVVVSVKLVEFDIFSVPTTTMRKSPIMEICEKNFAIIVYCKLNYMPNVACRSFPKRTS